jgi:tRNA pseudouridine38-40 synthase
MMPLHTTRKMTEKGAMRYKLLIEYDGTDFVGWQIQANGRSVQGVIEQAFADSSGKTVRVHGSGRTDVGVHARGQVAHVDLETTLTEEALRNAVNARLPHDVTVHAITSVPVDFHARYSASSRVYVYSIAHRRISIDRHRHWIVYGGFDHEAVARSVPLFHGTKDFTTFSKFAANQPHHFCHVFDARWESDGELSRFTIKANRFLYGMVRCILGALIRVGRGQCSPNEIARLVLERDRTLTPMLAPAHGLILDRVLYDHDERLLVSSIMKTLQAQNDGEKRAAPK